MLTYVYIDPLFTSVCLRPPDYVALPAFVYLRPYVHVRQNGSALYVRLFAPACLPPSDCARLPTPVCLRPPVYARLPTPVCLRPSVYVRMSTSVYISPLLTSV